MATLRPSRILGTLSASLFLCVFLFGPLLVRQDTAVAVGAGGLTFTAQAPAQVQAGQEVDYTLTVKNTRANSDTFYFAFNLPFKLSLVRKDGSNNVQCPLGGPPHICNSFTLNSQETKTFHIFLRPAADLPVGTIMNVAFDARHADGTDVVAVAVSQIVQGGPSGQPDLTVTKSNPTGVVRGGTVVYQLGVSNVGQAAAQNVRVFDVFPTSGIFTFRPQDSNSACSLQGSEVRCEAGTLNPNESKTFQVAFSVASAVSGQQCLETQITNVARAETTTGETSAGNNNAYVQTVITCPQVIHIPQCRDGIDNDNDGAVDYPNDFSCSHADDDDETNPRAQCQDGVDNGDSEDSLADQNDPGCHTDGNANNPASYNRQDNDESNTVHVPQCRDGIDNDNDGAVDYPNDFSCSHADDDDETNPRAQCQDGFDNNDSEDSLADQNDPGCHTDGNANNPASYNRQDNDESNTVASASFVLFKTDGESSASRGEELRYKIHVENASSVHASNVSVIDTLPAYVSFVSADHGGILSDGRVRWTNLSFGPGERKELRLTVRVSDNAPHGFELKNFVNIENAHGNGAHDVTFVNVPVAPPTVNQQQQQQQQQGIDQGVSQTATNNQSNSATVSVPVTGNNNNVAVSTVQSNVAINNQYQQVNQIAAQQQEQQQQQQAQVQYQPNDGYAYQDQYQYQPNDYAYDEYKGNDYSYQPYPEQTYEQQLQAVRHVVTGFGDSAGPLESTRRFLSPFRSETGSSAAVPVTVWTSIVLMVAGVGGAVVKKFFL